jgi:uncharacterized SAM-binding protein YcdF (DUF218 family)
MFFVLSKIGWSLIQPSFVLIAITVLGTCLLLTPLRRLSRVLSIGGGVTLGICAFTSIGTLLLRPLEDRFPFPDIDNIPEPAGIIVLGGGLAIGRSTQVSGNSITGPIVLGPAGERATEGMALARRFPNARLVFSGGSADLMGGGIPEGDIARAFYSRLGLPDGRLTIERRSRNTIENAQFSKKLLEPKPNEYWILVTSAAHMPRAVAVFRKATFSIVPYPVDYHTNGDASDFAYFSFSPIDNLSNIDIAAKEWIGLMVYWQTGHTNEFLPDPKIK